MSWSDEMIEKVWRKGKVVPSNDPSIWRKDNCGAWIKRNMHGDSDSELSFGWEVDHINPNGSDDISNLQPLQWENNRHKSDDYPHWNCKVCSDGTKNKYC